MAKQLGAVASRLLIPMHRIPYSLKVIDEPLYAFSREDREPTVMGDFLVSPLHVAQITLRRRPYWDSDLIASHREPIWIDYRLGLLHRILRSPGTRTAFGQSNCNLLGNAVSVAEPPSEFKH